MKKYSFVICALACLSLMLPTGCEDSKETSQAEIPQTEEAEKTEHNVIYTMSPEADLAHASATLEELVADSEFVAEVKVKETSSFVPNDTITIYTEITPEIINVYKGEYNGNSLVLGGGYMKYNDYLKCEGVSALPDKAMDFSNLSEEELKNGEIYFNWLDNYIPEKGDTLVFFGYELENGDYHITNSYQGMFLCENENVSNQALSINDNSGYTEPLVKDLQADFSEASQLAEFSSEVTDEKSVLTISKTEFLSKLNNLT